MLGGGRVIELVGRDASVLCWGFKRVSGCDCLRVLKVVCVCGRGTSERTSTKRRQARQDTIHLRQFNFLFKVRISANTSPGGSGVSWALGTNRQEITLGRSPPPVPPTQPTPPSTQRDGVLPLPTRVHHRPLLHTDSHPTLHPSLPCASSSAMVVLRRLVHHRPPHLARRSPFVVLPARSPACADLLAK